MISYNANQNYSDDELEEKRNVSKRIVEEYSRAQSMIKMCSKRIKIEKIKALLSELVSYANERDDLSMKYLIDQFSIYANKRVQRVIPISQ